MSDMTVPDRYLGDGVYASYDGEHVILDLRGQDDTTKIYMEQRVLDSLDGYLEDILLLRNGFNPKHDTETPND